MYFYLAILDLDKLPQPLTILLESLILLSQLVFFLLRLSHSCLVSLLLLAQVCDLPLQVRHELVLFVDLVCDDLLA